MKIIYLPRDDQGNITLSMKAQVTYIPNHQKRFIYNNTPISYKQSLSRPVLVVIQPESFGGCVNPYFTHLNSYLFILMDLRIVRSLLLSIILKSVSQYDYAVGRFTANSPIHTNRKSHGDCRRSPWYSNLCSSFFNTMNFLYFEEFRTKSSLKKIAGLGFVNIHQMILSQKVAYSLVAFEIHSHFGWWIARSLSCYLLLMFGSSLYRFS